MKVWLQGESKDFRAALVPKLSEGVVLTHQPRADILIHWLQPLEMIELLFPKLQEQIVAEGAIWIVMPNESERERRGSPFLDDEIKTAAGEAGMSATKTVEFNEKEEGVRFAVEKDKETKKKEPKKNSKKNE